MLYFYSSIKQGNWDLLIPMCEFALSSMNSASIRVSPAYVVFSYDPTLLLEHAVCKITDGPVLECNLLYS